MNLDSMLNLFNKVPRFLFLYKKRNIIFTHYILLHFLINFNNFKFKITMFYLV